MYLKNSTFSGFIVVFGTVLIISYPDVRFGEHSLHDEEEFVKEKMNKAA